MTEQTPDYVYFKGHRYILWHDSSGRLPMLSELGIHPNLNSTGALRGYEAEYEIDNNQLYLTKLNVGQAEREDQFPPVGGISPAKERIWGTDDDEDLSFYEFVYCLKHPLSLDGVITLNSAEWESILTEASPEILKIKLENGHLKAVKDVSREYKRLKQAVNLIEQDKNDQLERMPINEWINYRSGEIPELYRQFFDATDEEF